MYYVSKIQSRSKASHRKKSLCFPFPTHWLSVELISQLSNGTMGMLRLPSPCSFTSISLATDTIPAHRFSCRFCRCVYIPEIPGFVGLGQSFQKPYFLEWRREVLPCSHVNHSVSDIAQDPGRASKTCPFSL